MTALALAVLLAASPTVCAADPVVANARIKVTRGLEKNSDHLVVTVDVLNKGTADQADATQQHLELVRDGAVIGTQPIPALGGQQTYIASFRIVAPHVRHRAPLTVIFRYVLDSAPDAARANCAKSNDALTATL
jgi:hypothetical protein